MVEMNLTAPDCTAHGPLILAFLRGSLSDADGLRAEKILTDCPDCQAWMDTQFSGPAFDAVDQAVASGLENAALPDRRHRFGWMAAAAAIVMVAGGLTMMQLPDRSTPMMPDLQDQTQSTRIGSFDFEGGALHPPALQTGERPAVVEADPLFSDDLEDGIASSWTIHT